MLGLNILSIKQVKIPEAFPETSKESNSSSAMSFMDMLSSKISKKEDEGSFKKGAESLNNNAEQNLNAVGDNPSEFDYDNKKTISEKDEPVIEEKNHADENSKPINAGALFNITEIITKSDTDNADIAAINDKNIENKLEKKTQSLGINTKELIKQDSLIDINKNPSEEDKIIFTAEKTAIKRTEKSEINNESKKNDQGLLYDKINSLLNVIQNSSNQIIDKDIKASMKDVQDFFKKGSRGNDPERIRKALAQLESAADKMNDMKMSDKVLIKNLTAMVSEVLEKVRGRNFKNENRNSEKTAPASELLFRNTEISEIPKKSVTMKNSSEDVMSSMNTLLEKNSSVLKKALSSPERSKGREAFYEQLQQIIDKAKITVHDSKNGSFIFRLNPKELGSVNVNIGLEQGIVKGKFLVETNEAKELLIQNLDFVKTQLEESGISVGEFQVNVKEQGKPFDNKENGKDIKVNSGLASLNTEEYENAAAVPKHNGSVNMVI
jgi:flagellar hook-length control protein FliK